MVRAQKSVGARDWQMVAMLARILRRDPCSGKGVFAPHGDAVLACGARRRRHVVGLVKHFVSVVGAHGTRVNDVAPGVCVDYSNMSSFESDDAR